MIWDDSTCCTTWTSTAAIPTIEELLSVLQKFQAKDGVRKSRAYFDILGMTPCRHCGRKAEYHEGPPETFKMCRCMVDELRWTCVEAAPMAFCLIDKICGIEVEIVEVER